jgi:hypothetical protein
MKDVYVSLLVVFIIGQPIYAQNQIYLSGSSFASINNNRPDLLAGVQFYSNLSKHINLFSDFNYSFRHQISSTNRQITEVYVYDSNNPSSSEKYFSDGYKEDGYCVQLLLNPVYTIKNCILGIGIGYEYGEYESIYNIKTSGADLLPLHFLSTIHNKDENVIYNINAGYMIDPFLISVEFIAKDNDYYGMGLSICYSVYKGK